MSMDAPTVAQYLQAMEPRTASRIIKEFKSPQEQEFVQKVLEKLRQEGVRLMAPLQGELEKLLAGLGEVAGHGKSLTEMARTLQMQPGACGQVANLLVSRGIEPGDKVALSCPNLPYFPIVYYGILKAGAVVVPLNILLKRWNLPEGQGNIFVMPGAGEARQGSRNEPAAWLTLHGQPVC